MAFEKRTWLARIGQGLNKFIIGAKDGEGKQTLTNSPDSVTQQGDVISAENLNDLEGRIETAVNANETAIQSMNLTKIWENTSISPTSYQFGEQTIELNEIAQDIVIEYSPFVDSGEYSQRAFKHFRSFDTSAPLSTDLDRSGSLTSTAVVPVSQGSLEVRLSIRSRKVYPYTENGTTKVYFSDCLFVSFIPLHSTPSGSQGGMNYALVPIAIYKVGDIYNS